MSTLESIVEELRTLPAAKLEEAAALIHRLKEAGRVEHLAILRETAGVWSGSEGEAIEEGCEKIDARDW